MSLDKVVVQEEVFGIVFSLRNRLYHIANRFVPVSELEDIFQNALIEIWKSINNYIGRDVKTIKSWAARTMRNEAIHYLRARTAKKMFPSRESLLNNKISDTLVGYYLDPYEVASLKELRIIVRKAVSRLAEAQRKVVEAYHYQGKDFTTIANDLGIQDGAVRSTISKAWRNLRENLSHINFNEYSQSTRFLTYQIGE